MHGIVQQVPVARIPVQRVAGGERRSVTFGADLALDSVEDLVEASNDVFRHCLLDDKLLAQQSERERVSCTALPVQLAEV